MHEIEENIIDIQDTPSAAINLMYKKLVKSQTEHFRLADHFTLFGLKNPEVQALLANKKESYITNITYTSLQ
ncbi:8523_t:CDS:2 [Cetraspora pellucida]|uniref:8523_t:CDS:1 n=1 Tax=Cetraspora pellucida TaxID=1433469 RepID=A0ACA9K068_9GLOM|nr:8523_t:CDS:2 [Cetraspora pellucida]